jgi:hypothetical protein
MTDPLFLTAFVCIGTACLLAYLLGRYHGIGSAFASLRRSHELPGDRPASLQGDLPHVPVHARRSGR